MRSATCSAKLMRPYRPREAQALACLLGLAFLLLCCQALKEEALRVPSHPVKIDLNRASLEALAVLPGVGPVTAARIAAARPFDSLAELQELLGPARFRRLAPYAAIAPLASASAPERGISAWPPADPPELVR